jgi:predicted glycoside hydrolase/deacetylase ChbG (UPF0249 family)
VSKKLVTNADDFGFTPDVNQGIVDAHLHGILTAATLMANGDAFDDAVQLARQTPSLDIGCHLVLIGGKSLATGEPLPLTTTKLLAALALGRIDPYRELRPQVMRILEAGIRPTHLDTHKHTHLAPAVLQAVVRLAEEFRILWIRRPFDVPMGALAKSVPATVRFVNGVAGLMRGRFRRLIRKHGCRSTDAFAGFQMTGRFHTPELVKLIGSLPEGSTEFMCHPGHCGDALRRAGTRLKESRERELEALQAGQVREALAVHGVQLVNYSQL